MKFTFMIFTLTNSESMNFKFMNFTFMTLTTLEPDFRPLSFKSASHVIIEFTVISDQIKALSYEFHGKKYVIISVIWSTTSGDKYDICLDTDCFMTLINQGYLRQVLLQTDIKRWTSLMSVHGVRNKIIHTEEYAVIKMYFDRLVKGTPIRGFITIEVHLVEDLKADILIKTDTLEPQGFVINFDKKTIIIGSC